VTQILVTQLVISGVVLLTGVLSFAVTRWLRNRPPRWSTAHDRLLERNPMLNADQTLRWSVASRRVRTGPLTSLVVASALLLVAIRPTVATNDGDS
jgi:hypothetical protein